MNSYATILFKKQEHQGIPCVVDQVSIGFNPEYLLKKLKKKANGNTFSLSEMQMEVSDASGNENPELSDILENENLEVSDTSGNENPFDILFENLSDEQKRRKLIVAAKDINHVYALELQEVLNRLDRNCEEGSPDEAPISPHSLQGFYKFLNSITNLSRPTLGVTDTGNIRAQWRASKKRHLAIEYLNKEDAKIVVFAPDPGNAEKTIRTAFPSTIDGMWHILSSYNVQTWATE